MIVQQIGEFDRMCTDFGPAARYIARRDVRDSMCAALRDGLVVGDDVVDDTAARQTLGCLLAEKFSDEIGILDHPDEGIALLRRVAHWKDLERSIVITCEQRLEALTDMWLALDAWKRVDLPGCCDGIRIALRTHRYHVGRLEQDPATDAAHLEEARAQLSAVETSARLLQLHA